MKKAAYIVAAVIAALQIGYGAVSASEVEQNARGLMATRLAAIDAAAQ